MSFIIGFGSQEKAQQDMVYDWIFKNLQERHKILNPDWNYSHFSDEEFEEFKRDFGVFQKEIKEEYDSNDSSENRPERYFHIDYGVRMCKDMDTIFVAIDFWHINSRHAMSPDGMALFEEKKTFTVCTENLY